jgi:hypothetical protein
MTQNLILISIVTNYRAGIKRNYLKLSDFFNPLEILSLTGLMKKPLTLSGKELANISIANYNAVFRFNGNRKC